MSDTKQQNHENTDGESRQVEQIVRRCVCDGLDDAIRKGIKSMEEELAPTFAIEDYIFDMISGDWINCKCDASKSA